MQSDIRNLWKARDLLITWTYRDIRVRYKQSFLGVAWAVMQPLVMVAIFTLVFSYIVHVPTGDVPYPVFVYTALLPWTFFTTAITFGSSSLVGNINLVTKVYFPREILPFSAIGAGFVDFAVASTVYVGLLFLYRFPVSETIVLVPLLLLVQIVLMAGIILIVSALNVFYRDIRFVIPLALQLWLYATPIIYPLDLVPEQLRAIYMLNPMAGIITSYRAVVLAGTWPEWEYLALATFISIVIFIAGYAYFKKVEWQFADVI